MSRAVSFPFRIDAHGHVAATGYEPKIWMDRVRAVLNTQLGDRVMRPSFGYDSERLILHLQEMSLAELRSSVAQALAKNLPSVHLDNVSIRFDPENNETAVMSVEFTGPDGTKSATEVSFLDGNVTYPDSSNEVTL